MDETKTAMYDIIIVGAGPAGLSAAIYTSRALLNSLVIESPAIISQVSYAYKIENYPGFPDGISGLELIERFKAQAKKAGALFELATAKDILNRKKGGMDIWQVKTEDKTYTSLAVIIASGCRPKGLGIAGEEGFYGKGVSYCVVCDGPFFKDKDVIVIGATGIAVEEALFLSKFARKVMIITRADRLAAPKGLQDKLLSNDKVEVLVNLGLKEILGTDRVGAVKVQDLKTAKQKDIPCSGVFIFAGFAPSTDFVKGVAELDDKGYIVVDNKRQTSKDGLFACGDCCKNPLRQVISASADGATAAFFANRYIETLIQKKGET